MRFPSASSSTSVRKRRFHRIGIRVVTVVDELHAVNLFDLQTRFGQRRGGEKTGGAFFERKAKERDRQRRRASHFAPCANPGTGNCARQRCAPSKMVNSDPFALWVISPAQTVPPVVVRRKHFRARARGDFLAERIVRIQNDRSFGADRFGERAFLGGDRFARTHELDVRDADVRDDGGIRRGDFRERGDFAGMIHADFPNGDLIFRRRFQHGARKTDVIVEVAFRFRDAKIRRQHRGGKIFRAGFAVAAGDGEHFERKRFPIIRGQVLIGASACPRRE